MRNPYALGGTPGQLLAQQLAERRGNLMGRLRLYRLPSGWSVTPLQS